ncbi:MAG: hypothetical protein IJB27_00900 [Clostridia bacterium]|nr:hypothetical protein [Clostridia bacterium]
MKGWYVKAIILCFSTCLLFYTGCVSAYDERLSIDYAQSRLETICNEKETVTLFQLGGTFSKNVWADEELLGLLCLAEWEPVDIDYQSKEYQKQEYHTIVLEHVNGSIYKLAIGSQYGAVLRLENITEKKEGDVLSRLEYHSSQCFSLPQSGEGEIVEAIQVLIDEYIMLTGDEGCNF